MWSHRTDRRSGRHGSDSNDDIGRYSSSLDVAGSHFDRQPTGLYDTSYGASHSRHSEDEYDSSSHHHDRPVNPSGNASPTPNNVHGSSSTLQQGSPSYGESSSDRYGPYIGYNDYGVRSSPRTNDTASSSSSHLHPTPYSNNLYGNSDYGVPSSSLRPGHAQVSFLAQAASRRRREQERAPSSELPLRSSSHRGYGGARYAEESSGEGNGGVHRGSGLWQL